MESENELQWDVRCARCGWQTHVRALTPLRSAADSIMGFQEAYICPIHYEVASRPVYINEPSTDLAAAYFRYFSGLVSRSDRMPRCPVCEKPMQGGQVLQDLPYQLQPHIELQRWIGEKLTQLERMVSAEKLAIRRDEQSEEQAIQSLEAEAQILHRFYETWRQQLDVYSLTFIDDFPNQLGDWSTMLTDAIQAAESRLAQLLQRQQTEANKTPGRCPDCQQPSVYLVRSTAH